ncbi:FtsW/RodA/SpoVE family cell cycle protein [Listeria booriae]|uniref:FtsW/RodA/SpoVE family cell cycle protein n=1 Tax=Listeria booriae TaxID=1552123 RepID=A0A7X0Z7U0_9LIST|nr:FtsW/RodA/SpoVE family cell cycle protein [Listeria booriae]MBC2177569.1 FtsW/RodA/SpoVE family cell cycle protein [Listeria booriae]
MTQQKKFSETLVVLVCLLSIMSCVAIFMAQQTNQYDANFFRMQLMYILVGFTVCYLISKINIAFVRDHIIWLYIAILILLVGILIPNPFVEAVNGATRWYQLAGFSLQPSEITKSAFIIVLAHFAVKYEQNLWKQLAVFWSLAVVVLLFIMKQPDLGTTIVYFISAFTISILAIKSTKAIIAIILSFIVTISAGLYLVIYNVAILEKLGFHSYQFTRVYTWLDPASDPNAFYQIDRSLKAIGSGTMFGSNGTSVYIPESHTDMIFSTIANQFGFIGVSILLIIFMLFIHQIIVTALSMKSKFSTYVLAGFAMMFAFNIFENIAMTIGMMPLTGIPLPFISYGGSSILGNMIALGTMLAVIKSDAKETLHSA